MDSQDHLEGYAQLLECGETGLMIDLRISIREKGVFACFHPDAGDLFNVCSDLKRICWTLYDPKKRLEKNVRPTSNKS